MALVVTPSAQNADSYATLAEYYARASLMGWTLAAGDDVHEVQLRRAAIGLGVGRTFRGRKSERYQALDWPRERVGYVDGWWIDGNVIPAAIKNAQIELAQAIGAGFDPLVPFEGTVRRLREKVDVIETETEYQGGKGRVYLDAVDVFLRDYVEAGRGQAKMLRA